MTQVVKLETSIRFTKIQVLILQSDQEKNFKKLKLWILLFKNTKGKYFSFFKMLLNFRRA
jgi:hypothetical protein